MPFQEPGGTPVPPHVEQSVESILEIHRRAESELSGHQRAIERITRFVGRPHSVYAILGFVVAWTVGNATLGMHAFDPPPFPRLDGLFSLTAVLMAVVILTTENRQAQIAAQREKLDLQLSALTEAKVAKVIELVEALRRDHPQISDRPDRDASEMTQSTDPATMLRLMEEK